MDFGDYIRLIRRSAWIIIALVLLGTLAGNGLTLVEKPEYGASATGQVRFAATSPQDLGQAGPIAQSVATTLANNSSTDLVLQPVIDRLRLRTTTSALAPDVAAAVGENSSNITISVKASTAAGSASIANAVLAQLNTSIDTLLPGASKGRVRLGLFTTSSARVPAEPENPKPLRNLALGALAGLIVGLVIAVLRQLLDSRLLTLHDLERVTDRPVLGLFLRDERPPRTIATRRVFAGMSGAEAVRTLRTNLRFLETPTAVRSFVVSSPSAFEDRTEQAAGLAIAMSDLGRRVLVVDADLRRARLAAYLSVDGTTGLTDVLSGEARTADAIQAWNGGSLHVLPAGSPTDRPNEMVQSDAMADLVARLQIDYDAVIYNVPPLLVASDAAIVAAWTSGALVVVEMGRTTRTQLVSALTALDRVNAQTIGLVATGLREAARPSRYARRVRRTGRPVRAQHDDAGAPEPQRWTEPAQQQEVR